MAEGASVPCILLMIDAVILAAVVPLLALVASNSNRVELTAVVYLFIRRRGLVSTSHRLYHRRNIDAIITSYLVLLLEQWAAADTMLALAS